MVLTERLDDGWKHDRVSVPSNDNADYGKGNLTMSLELILNFLSAIAASIAVAGGISLIRKRLASVRFRKKITVDGTEVEVDPDRLDSLQEAVTALMKNPTVFIAHSSHDREIALKLASDLRDHGLQVWMAEEELRPGDSIERKISSAIGRSGYLLALVSTYAQASEWVQREFAAARLREDQGLWPRVIPVLIDEVDEMPVSVGDKLYVDLKADYNDGLQSIVNAIEGEWKHDAL